MFKKIYSKSLSLVNLKIKLINLLNYKKGVKTPLIK